ncbi:hypothetical protein [Edwardsiella tarda]|uniref:hypothetical protein n=1 Tax=Edwardsiella tarda TaxID=636 RepID=UPI00351BFB9D
MLVMVACDIAKQANKIPAVMVVTILPGMYWFTMGASGNAISKVNCVILAFFPFRRSAVCSRHTAHDAPCQLEKSSSGCKAAAQKTDQREGMRTGAAAGGLNFSGTVRRLSGIGENSRM